jgi:hypothetical protein
MDHVRSASASMFAIVPDRKYMSAQPPTASTGIVIASSTSTNARSRQKSSCGAVARLTAEALAEHADASGREGLRGEPLDDVVRVATALAERAVVPRAGGATDAAHERDEGHVAAAHEEVGFAEKEVAQDGVGRELDDQCREPTGDRLAVARGSPEITRDRDAVAHFDVDRGAEDVVRGRPFVRPPLLGRGRH